MSQQFLLIFNYDLKSRTIFAFVDFSSPVLKLNLQLLKLLRVDENLTLVLSSGN